MSETSDQDTVRLWSERDSPICPYCDCSLEFVEFFPGLLTNEVWECPCCEEYSEWLSGDYGLIEIEITREEYNVRKQRERELNYLRRRYGASSPSSIVDYWL